MSTEQPTVVGPTDIVSELKAASILNKSTSTLSRWRQHNLGPPYIKNGRTVEYRLPDLDAYRQRCRHDPAAATDRD
jgi:hypothetical protein